MICFSYIIYIIYKSKKTGGCQERMQVADKAMAEIDLVREKLRPVATRASILYFVPLGGSLRERRSLI